MTAVFVRLFVALMAFATSSSSRSSVVRMCIIM
jgi:hypothetical protein